MTRLTELERHNHVGYGLTRSCVEDQHADIDLTDRKRSWQREHGQFVGLLPFPEPKRTAIGASLRTRRCQERCPNQEAGEGREPPVQFHEEIVPRISIGCCTIQMPTMKRTRLTAAQGINALRARAGLFVRLNAMR